MRSSALQLLTKSDQFSKQVTVPYRVCTKPTRSLKLPRNDAITSAFRLFSCFQKLSYKSDKRLAPTDTYAVTHKQVHLESLHLSSLVHPHPSIPIAIPPIINLSISPIKKHTYPLPRLTHYPHPIKSTKHTYQRTHVPYLCISSFTFSVSSRSC